MAIVTYLNHSGFLIEQREHALVFDFYNKQVPEALSAALQGDAQTLVFASHRHKDHYQKCIHDWARAGWCHLVLSDDIRTDQMATYVHPGSDLTLGSDVRVRAFGSTDEGVSFFVQLPGVNVFHAGDLNFWHWRLESSKREVAEAQARFEAVLHTIPEEPMDICLFPIDPRMGPDADEGAAMFIERFRPKLFFPMHFWDAPEIAEAFARRTFPGTKIIALTAIGQRYDTQKEDDL